MFLLQLVEGVRGTHDESRRIRNKVKGPFNVKFMGFGIKKVRWSSIVLG